MAVTSLDEAPSNAPKSAGGRLLSISPYFYVRDVQKSSAYYGDKLGFVHECFRGDPPSLCITSRDGIMIMLAATEDPTKVRPNSKDGEAWDAYITIDDSEAMFQELRQRGAEIVFEPSVTFDSQREFAVRDLDGYILAFGQELGRKG